MDPSLTDKDGKQDAKEDDDEKHELHVFEPIWVNPAGYNSRRTMRLRYYEGTVKGEILSRSEQNIPEICCLDEFIAMHNNTT